MDYVGLTINCSDHSLGLRKAKAGKALEGLSHLIAGRVVSRRFLQSLAGLLTWVTWIAPYLRPWLHPIFHNKCTGKIIKRKMPINQWLEFVACVDHNLHVCRAGVKGQPFKVGAKLLAVAGKRVSS